jgi:hypothetical protein
MTCTYVAVCSCTCLHMFSHSSSSHRSVCVCVGSVLHPTNQAHARVNASARVQTSSHNNLSFKKDFVFKLSFTQHPHINMYCSTCHSTWHEPGSNVTKGAEPNVEHRFIRGGVHQNPVIFHKEAKSLFCASHQVAQTSEYHNSSTTSYYDQVKLP